MGRFGRFGGQYVPETLMPALAELEQSAAQAWADPAFTGRLNHLLKTYVGRATPLYEAERLTAHYRRDDGGPRIWLKREDLKPHRRSQNQQCPRPGAFGPADGQKTNHC
jgi:tryptophan synthase beta chain